MKKKIKEIMMEKLGEDKKVRGERGGNKGGKIMLDDRR